MLLLTPKLFLLFLPLLQFSTAETWIKSGYWYSGSEFPVPDINSALYTHLIAAFVHINSSNYELYVSPSDEPYISTFTDIVKKKNPSVVTLLSIWCGVAESFDHGEANSSIFFSMTSQSSSRRSFIESSIRKARSYGFQGIDLFGATPSTPENMTNMEAFLDEWRRAINLESSTSRLILTMAGYYSPVLDSMTYPVDSIRKNLDWVHLRSYDYHMSSKDKFTGAHAALYDPLSRLNTDFGIKNWISKGLPANKLVLGLAYHGYAWTLLDPKNNAIGAPAAGLAITKDGSMSYKYIKWYMTSYGATSVFNSTYVVNYCTIGSFWIGFDDVEAIKTKVSYAKEKGLLGYSIWQVPNDDTKDVLSRAAQAAEDQQKKQHLLFTLLPASAITFLLVAIICYLKRKFILSKVRQITDSGKRSISPHLQAFSYSQIKAATKNFSEENKLGEGGFGPVYKGKLKDGQEIAVKRLSNTSTQGSEEFKNEVSLAAKLQHVNLVRLIGICTEKEEKMLIYDYMPNKSLDFYLYDPTRRLFLDWEKRLAIIEGVTQGLLYLQEYSAYTVIHRDLKASNILLDSELKPKISDFGIAKLFRKDENEANTSRIIGTYGYVPPEYVKRGMYSRKYDVYSFGVLILQIISGKRSSCLYGMHKNLNLLEFAYQLWKDGSALEFLDPSLDDDQSPCKLLRCMQVALLCVQENWEDRPSMLEVSSMLKNENESLPTPKMPAFSTNEHKDVETNFRTDEEFCSVNMATVSDLMPR
ncbi:cysteine-rich receptor-like protein kinase 10 isoform X1 [Coffea eugenioides]|nr:cysteine-rich receptor-like protein kinase 10 isoform X1 [Coffea eugenioides]